MNILKPYFDLIATNRNFRYLWFSRVVSLLGDSFNLIASAVLIAQLSDTSGMAITGLFIARLLPPFLLGPFAGVVADRLNRRMVLIVSDGLRALIVLNFLLVEITGQIWLLYLLTILQLSISAFYEPASAALIPSLVKKDDLVIANSLSGLTWSTTLAIGAALGGLMTMLLGITAAFVFDALSYAASTWLTLQIVLDFDEADNSTADESTRSESGWQTFMSGMRYLSQQPIILGLALVKAAGAISHGGIDVVQVTFAELFFPLGGDSSATLGLIYCIIGIGTGIGPIVARHVAGDTSRAMYWGILISFVFATVGYLLIGFASTLSLLLLGTLLRTIGTGIGWVYSSSLLQINVPDRLLGRVFAFDLAMMTLASAISSLIAGWSRDKLGIGPHETSMLLGGISLFVTMSWGLFLFRVFNQVERVSD